jgi:hypothetical protein
LTKSSDSLEVAKSCSKWTYFQLVYHEILKEHLYLLCRKIFKKRTRKVKSWKQRANMAGVRIMRESLE